MMIKPGISELSRCVDSRYTLVTMAAKRARMLGESNEEVKTQDSLKPVSKAVHEIAEGKVSYVRHKLTDNDEMSWQTELIELEDTVPQSIEEQEEE